MILAAVIPYHHPRGAGVGRASSCVVAIADGGREIIREWIEVGYLAPVDDGDRLTRVVGPAEVAAVAAQAAALMVSHGAQEVAVEAPAGSGVEADRGRAIALAIVEALPGVPALNIGQAKGDLAARLAALLKGEAPDTDGVDAPGPELMLPGTPPNRERPCHAPLGSADGTLTPASCPEPTPAPASPQAPKAGRRIAGIDPGAKHIAIAVVEELRVEVVGAHLEMVDAADQQVRTSPCPGERGPTLDQGALPHAPDCESQDERAQVVHTAHPTPGHTVPQPVARLVAWLPLTIGRDVPLGKPRVITRKDGATYTKTTRHEVTDADVLQLLRDVAGFLAEHDVDAAVVESATHAHMGAGALLLRSQALGGEIAGWLRAAGLPVSRVASSTWRASAKKRAGLRALEGASDDSSAEDVAGSIRGSGARGEDSRGAEERPGLQGGRRVGPDGVGPEEPGGVRLASDEQAAGRVHGAGTGRGGYTRDSGLVRTPAGPGGHVHPAHPAPTWPAAVRALVSGLPTLPPDAREHMLDAAGAALWGLAPPPVAPATTPRTPRGKGKVTSRQAKRDAENAAMGCLGEVCRARGKRGHEPTCPVALAQRAKQAERVRESMKGNSNARKGASE